LGGVFDRGGGKILSRAHWTLYRCVGGVHKQGKTYQKKRQKHTGLGRVSVHRMEHRHRSEVKNLQKKKKTKKKKKRKTHQQQTKQHTHPQKKMYNNNKKLSKIGLAPKKKLQPKACWRAGNAGEGGVHSPRVPKGGQKPLRELCRWLERGSPTSKTDDTEKIGTDREGVTTRGIAKGELEDQGV